MRAGGVLTAGLSRSALEPGRWDGWFQPGSACFQAHPGVSRRVGGAGDSANVSTAAGAPTG